MDDKFNEKEMGGKKGRGGREENGGEQRRPSGERKYGVESRQSSGGRYQFEEKVGLIGITTVVQHGERTWHPTTITTNIYKEMRV